jgi:hypothetical protein
MATKTPSLVGWAAAKVVVGNGCWSLKVWGGRSDVSRMRDVDL